MDNLNNDVFDDAFKAAHIGKIFFERRMRLKEFEQKKEQPSGAQTQINIINYVKHSGSV